MREVCDTNDLLIEGSSPSSRCYKDRSCSDFFYIQMLFEKVYLDVVPFLIILKIITVYTEIKKTIQAKLFKARI